MNNKNLHMTQSLLLKKLAPPTNKNQEEVMTSQGVLKLFLWHFYSFLMNKCGQKRPILLMKKYIEKSHYGPEHKKTQNQ